MKFILLTWLGLFIWGVIYSCKNMSSINYTITKNPQKNSERIELKKYCKYCNKYTIHKETK